MRHPIRPRRRLHWIVVGCMAAAVPHLQARADESRGDETGAGESLPEAERTSSRVEQWLALQRSRSQEAPLRRMPSEAAILVYARYLEGFLLGPLAAPRREAPRDGD